MTEVHPKDGIIRDRPRLLIQRGGTPAEALVSSIRPEVKFWRQAIDQILDWKLRPVQFEIDDQPDEDILCTAIDYAVDQMEREDGDPAPNSVVPSGSGRIAMEWNDGLLTVIIEFTALGVANRTEFNGGKVVKTHILNRNPKSRQLEFRG